MSEQVLLTQNFRSGPGSGQNSSARNAGVGGGGQIEILTTLLTFSLLIGEDFGVLQVLLSLLSNCSVFMLSDKCAEDTAIPGKREESPEILTNL